MLPYVSNYADFLQHQLENRPCLFPASLTADWPAFTDWQTSQGINFALLSERYGSRTVSVVDCKTSARSERVLRDVLDLWQKDEGKHLYIKDWHLYRNSSIPFYDTPKVFKDDWMNASSTTDDFRFVYMGRSGTYTGLHADVYTSYSWSTNIVGRKRWYLFPPGVTSYLRKYDRRTSEVVPDVREVDQKIFPNFGKAWKQVVIVDQEEGETIFVPSGWYHQVINLTDCISINHNWCNSTNLVSMYFALVQHVQDVEEALSDVKELLQQHSGWKAEWYKIVQDVLKADSGWDWKVFWSMIKSVLEQWKEADQSKEWYCPPELRPPAEYTRSQLTTVLADFTTHKEEMEHLEGLGQIINSIQSLIPSL